MELLKRVLALEQQLYKANDQLTALKDKCAAKNEKIICLQKEITIFKKREKELNCQCESDNLATLTVR